MLAKIYIEALLVDEELADQVWEAWVKGRMNDHFTSLAWELITTGLPDSVCPSLLLARERQFQALRAFINRTSD